MEKTKDGEIIGVGDDTPWSDCIQNEEPDAAASQDSSTNNDNGNEGDTAATTEATTETQPLDSSSGRRILDQVAKASKTSVNPEKFNGKYITLKKKADAADHENVLIKPFDDGLYFQFKDKIKPRQVSFYCSTDTAEEAESCDIRLFQLNKDKSVLEDVETSWKQREII